jgi:hypothetical protein
LRQTFLLRLDAHVDGGHRDLFVPPNDRRHVATKSDIAFARHGVEPLLQIGERVPDPLRELLVAQRRRPCRRVDPAADVIAERRRCLRRRAIGPGWRRFRQRRDLCALRLIPASLPGRPQRLEHAWGGDRVVVQRGHVVQKHRERALERWAFGVVGEEVTENFVDQLLPRRRDIVVQRGDEAWAILLEKAGPVIIGRRARVTAAPQHQHEQDQRLAHMRGRL